MSNPKSLIGVSLKDLSFLRILSSLNGYVFVGVSGAVAPTSVSVVTSAPEGKSPDCLSLLAASCSNFLCFSLCCFSALSCSCDIHLKRISKK